MFSYQNVAQCRLLVVKHENNGSCVTSESGSYVRKARNVMRSVLVKTDTDRPNHEMPLRLIISVIIFMYI